MSASRIALSLAKWESRAPSHFETLWMLRILQTGLLPQDYFPISYKGTEAFGALRLGDNLISCLALTVSWFYSDTPWHQIFQRGEKGPQLSRCETFLVLLALGVSHEPTPKKPLVAGALMPGVSNTEMANCLPAARSCYGEVSGSPFSIFFPPRRPFLFSPLLCGSKRGSAILECSTRTNRPSGVFSFL